MENDRQCPITEDEFEKLIELDGQVNEKFVESTLPIPWIVFWMKVAPGRPLEPFYRWDDSMISAFVLANIRQMIREGGVHENQTPKAY